MSDTPPTVVTNWSGNQSCSPLAVHTPTSTAEVARIVSAAAESGDQVKVIGAGHSFTSAAMTDGVLLRLDGLAAVESVDVLGVATVGAGISLSALNRELRSRGRGLPNLGDIDKQSLAGATATATHGTGAQLGNLSTGIVGLELVTGAGEVLWCDTIENADVFRAARVSVGALGIITRIAIETVPAFNLHSVESPEPIGDLLKHWEDFINSAQHVEFFWMPGTQIGLVKRNNPTSRDGSTLRTAKDKAEKLLVENVAFGAAMRTVRRFPGTREFITTAIGGLVSGTERIDRSERIFVTPRHVRFMEMEYGIPVAAVPEAFRRVQELASAMPDPPAFPVEVRVSAADDIDLSTAEGRDSGWIAVHRYQGVPYDEYFKGVEAIMDDYDGRPHWGKFHYQTVETLAPRYPQWDAFAGIRNRTDPDRIFANTYTQRVLGD